MRHPAKVKKVVAMAANLNPTEDAVQPEVIATVKTYARRQCRRRRARRHKDGASSSSLNCGLDEPHIELTTLSAIAAPTLILASDHDVIRDEHTVAIYRHLPNAQLAIFPDATHMVPFDEPEAFNATVDRFFRTPFVKKDRVADMFACSATPRIGGREVGTRKRNVSSPIEHGGAWWHLSFVNTRSAPFLWKAPPDVALFLPFRCNKERQTAASAGTKRRSKIGGFYE